MSTIIFTGQNDALDGFPRDLIEFSDNGAVDNGQMAAARPVRSMERALQVIGARRRMTFPALSVPVQVTQADPNSSRTLPLCYLPREAYSARIVVTGFYSTDSSSVEIGQISVSFGVSGSTTGTLTTATSYGTQGNSIDLAERFEVGFHVIGDGDKADLGYEELSLTITSGVKTPNNVTVNVYSVTVIVIPEDEVENS